MYCQCHVRESPSEQIQDEGVWERVCLLTKKPAIKIFHEMSLKVRGEMGGPERLQIRLRLMERK
jgi:hypothetical protein